jgi:hypothetical protein
VEASTLRQTPSNRLSRTAGVKVADARGFVDVARKMELELVAAATEDFLLMSRGVAGAGARDQR